MADRHGIVVLIVGVAVIGAIAYSVQKQLSITNQSSDTSPDTPIASPVLKYDPTLGVQGAGVTSTHGPIASILNQLTFNQSDGSGVNDYVLYVQSLQGNLKNLIDLGLGNANVDQTEFNGISYADTVIGPSYFSSN